MKMFNTPQVILKALLGVSLLWTIAGIGCNPNFLASLGGQASLPTAPGANPYLLVRTVNQIVAPPKNNQSTASGVVFELSFRTAGGNKTQFPMTGGGLETGEDIGDILPCNITTLTVGDVDDLTYPGANIVYNPILDPIYQPINPLGKVLQNGVDFRCGDVITFITHNAPEDSQSFALDYQVQSGENVAGPFSGPDTFTLFNEESVEWFNQFNPVP